MLTPGGPPQSEVSTTHPRHPAHATTQGPLRGSSDLPSVETPLTPEEVLAKLAAAGKAGRLPGFARAADGRSFEVSVLAGIFDHDLHGELSASRPATIRFALRARRRLPAIVIVAVVLSFWPGLPITDSMLRLYFRTYHDWGIETWWWYIPLVVMSLPPLWSLWKKSRREARAEADKVIERIAALTTGAARGPEPSDNGVQTPAA